MQPRILIIGATSAIAQRVAKQYANQSAEFFLVARDKAKLAIVVDDLLVRGASRVNSFVLDVRDVAQQTRMIEAAYAYLQGFDVVLIAHGWLASQKACEEEVALTLEAFEVNAISVISLLTQLANKMALQTSGTIAVISSVAGDRVLRKHYVYGAAKAAVSAFLQGLRARLYAHNIHVLTIKPGYVATPMTASMKKNCLFSSPDRVAKNIVKAIQNKRNIIYTPWFWMPILFVLKCLPEFIIKRIR